MAIRIYDAAEVRALLDFPGCIAAVRAAMAAFSASGTAQPLRQIVELGEGRLFGLMPGRQPDADGFGAKILSVFTDPARPGRAEHKGVVVLFDGAGDVACIADAAAITEIRTAAASAVATDALARPDARRLAIFGCGLQARSHIRALSLVRAFDDIVVWGRDPDRAERFATAIAAETGLPVRAEPDPRRAAGEADVICALTGAATPILHGAWVRPGTHINAVGSSHPGPVEVDSALVVASRYVADSRRSAMAAAAEFLDAKAAGLIGDEHIVAEIGEILLGRVPARNSPLDITLYKSLGHIVQDLAATAYVHAKAGT
jgi:ornithine cyclodeaminase